MEANNVSNKVAVQNADKYLNSVKNIEKFSEAPELSISPFIPKMISSFEWRTKAWHSEKVMTGLDIVNQKTGEVISGVNENRVFANKQLVDKHRFIKIYFDRLISMFHLSKTAIRVFGYIMTEMTEPRNINQDCIYIGVQGVMDYCGYKTRNMVYVGLTELIATGFIARASKPPSHYWIDPKTAFNGNRIIIMNEYIKKKDTPAEIAIQEQSKEIFADLDEQ